MVKAPSSEDFFPQQLFEDEATRLYDAKKLRTIARSIFQHSDASRDAVKDARATIPDFEDETEVQTFDLEAPPPVSVAPRSPTPAAPAGGRRAMLAALIALAIGGAGSAAVFRAPEGAIARAVERALSVVFEPSRSR